MEVLFEHAEKFSKRGIVGRDSVYKLIKSGWMPGFYCGRVFKINVPLALAKFEQESGKQREDNI